MKFETGIKALKMIARPCGAAVYELAVALELSIKKTREVLMAINKEFDIYAVDSMSSNPRYERYFLGLREEYESQIISCLHYNYEDSDVVA